MTVHGLMPHQKCYRVPVYRFVRHCISENIVVPTPTKMIDRIENSIAQLIEKGKVPGMQVAIIKGQEIWTKGFGFKNMDTGTLVDENTIFEAASLTKPMTAYLMMMLADEGSLDLGRSTLEYLTQEELEDFIGHPIDLIDGTHSQWAAQITAMHLLSHQAGIPEEIGKEVFTMLCPPGTRVTYSPAGYALMKKIVEKIKGKTLDVLFQEYLFEPFNMRNSSMVWREEYRDRMANPHGMFGDPMDIRTNKGTDAAAGLYTTCYDYALFVKAVMDGAGLSKEMKEEYLKTRMVVHENMNLHWAMGFGIQQDPEGPAIWQCGNVGVYRGYIFAYPEEHLGLIYMTNSFNGHSICKEMTLSTIGRDTRGMDFLAYLQYDSLAGEFCCALIEHGLEANKARLAELRATYPDQFNTKAVLWIGYTFLESHRYEDGISLLKMVMEEQPDSASITYEITKAYLAWGDLENATYYCAKTKKLAATDPDFERALLELAVMYIEALKNPMSLSPEYLSEVAGAYGDRRFIVKDNELYFSEDSTDLNDFERLIPVAKDIFALEGSYEFRIRFVFGDDGKPTKAIGLHGISYQDFTYRDAHQEEDILSKDSLTTVA